MAGRKKKTSKRRKKHGPRYKVKGKPGAYVIRDSKGRFKKWVRIRRSISTDKARKAKKKASRPGYGHVADYPKRKKRKRFLLF